MLDTTDKICQNCKKEFTIEPEDFDFYKKVNVVPPTFCPDCRLQRRMSFRNERSLYKDICDLCGKNFVSMYSPDKHFTVYCKDCWYSDKWDPLHYGQKYNPEKPFLAQFHELLKAVPQIGIVHIHNNINCDYSNYTADSKNAYLSQSVIAGSENVYYSRNIDNSKEIFDCFAVKDSEQCYENVDASKNYRCKFMVRSRDCISSAFLFDCVNCQNCFMSSNLRNKQFVIHNKQYTKEGYEVEIKKFGTGTYSNLLKFKSEFAHVAEPALHKFGNLIKTLNCTGNNIDSSKNAKQSFDLYGSENIKFCIRTINSFDSYDTLGCANAELIYEQVGGGYESYNSKFLCHGDVNTDCIYTDWCQNSSNLFGCAGVRKKQYCILNVQYSKEEYEKLAMEIMSQMNSMPYSDKKGRVYKYGEFFPIEISPFAYNETIAQEYFPLTKEKALEDGYAWHDPEPAGYTPTIKAENLPDDIFETEDAINEHIISCSECGKPYRILKQELEFLKQHSIALPRLCPECRHKHRFDLRNPLKLWHRKCMCQSTEAAAKTNGYKNTAKHFHGSKPCPNEFETSYAPDPRYAEGSRLAEAIGEAQAGEASRREMVYCESCYNNEIV